jgi:NADPH-dependent ferric siderophore reductase
MASLKDRVVERAARAVLRAAIVTRIEDINDRFRLLTVACQASWSPGDKVQFWLGGTQTRTYTPFGWDEGSVSFLVYRHGASPATRWVDGLSVDQTLYFLGPRGSVNLTSLDRAPVFVGDETSFALASSWPGDAPAYVFEVSDPVAADEALARLGLAGCALVARSPGDAHHGDLARHVVRELPGRPGAPLVLTGKAQSIKHVRRVLKDEGLAPAVRVKAYWDPNRSGMD